MSTRISNEELDELTQEIATYEIESSSSWYSLLSLRACSEKLMKFLSEHRKLVSIDKELIEKDPTKDPFFLPNFTQ
ncbi:MAG: hypothetical protein WBG46_11150 [Nonlabens sp.]